MMLAEGMTLVRQDVEIAEVRLSRAEERTGLSETEGAGGAVVNAGLTRVPLVCEGEAGMEEVESSGLTIVLGAAVGPFVGARVVLLGDG